MAVTKGQGNPNWSREEVIRALELLQVLGDSIPGPGDERIVKLSREFRALPYQSTVAKNESFRNPDGVVFKLQNLSHLAEKR